MDKGEEGCPGRTRGSDLSYTGMKMLYTDDKRVGDVSVNMTLDTNNT